MRLRRDGGSPILDRLRRLTPAQLAALPPRLTLEQQAALLAGEEPAPKRTGNRRGPFPTEPFPWTYPGRTLHLVLPGYLPPSLNEYSRRKAVRIRAVPECMQHLQAALLEAQAAQADTRTFWRVRLVIELWFPVRRRRDSRTNWSKVVEDALVDLGLIVDDSDEWCVTEVRPPQVDKQNPRTEITLTELGVESG